MRRLATLTKTCAQFRRPPDLRFCQSLWSRPPNRQLKLCFGEVCDQRTMTEASIRNKPGMASVKDMPLLQDGPPPGGFAPVRYARRIPSKGPSAVAIFLAAFGAFSWGMYEVGKGNKIRRAIKEEKYAARRAILPMLQAEEDERFVKEWKKYLEEEARIMKDVPGWKVGESVYHSGRWMPPATGEMRPEVW
ncbi:hypothetical protein E3N88_01070 [Mikania micrantha]|uniref:NADH dehydrogenase [ubiquinone] 1 alpha subcomplex subunit 13 n=1 Tax=Mikania micrantha TaxID=192012 RepID=A0A5N6PZZ1_9ASTR|nr:hypothetical protein E3N88_01070 [Mikania micrantha]